MSRFSALITLGILVMLVPFSGLPQSIRSFLAVIFGAGILAIGLALRAHAARMAKVPESPAM